MSNKVPNSHDYHDQDNMHVRADYAAGYDRVEIRVFYRNQFDKREVFAADDLTLKRIEEGGIFPHVLRLSMEHAQELMNDLWHAGIRPTNVRYKDETTSAISRHLDDMRAIVAAKLNVTLPVSS